MSSRDNHRSPHAPRTRQEPHYVSSNSSVASINSVTSSFRHHNAPFAPPTPSTPKPTLIADAKHRPKTRGTVGLMVVGFGGANGTTLLAGILANRLNTQWHGPQGQPRSPNYNGCISQLKQKGKFGGVGFKDKVHGLADASMAAIGGWVSIGSLQCSYSLISLLNTHNLYSGHKTSKARRCTSIGTSIGL